MSRAQAALEFLTTYAWAFLVIIIMVGALAYFGVLSPSKLLPDRCNFGSEVGCNKDLLVVKNVNTDTGGPSTGGDYDNVLEMRLENNAGTPITVTSISVTTDVTTLGTCATFLSESGLPIQWASDATVPLVMECTTGINLVKKEKIKFNIEINYYPSAAGSTYAKTVFGEVFTTIQ